MYFHVLLLTVLVLVKQYIVPVSSNALLKPQHRGVIWAKSGTNSGDYNYMGINCGGIHTIKKTDGKCGLCGDPFDGPRLHETGGKYATGKVVETIARGEKTINVNVLLDSDQAGYFEFSLCASNGTAETQECFDKHNLKIFEGFAQGDEFAYVVQRAGIVQLKLDIPERLVCDRCVLQWKYTTGNTFGRDENGHGCLGCGHQETYINCADIKINGWEGPSPSLPIPLNATTTTATTALPRTITQPFSTIKQAFQLPDPKPSMSFPQVRHSTKHTSQNEFDEDPSRRVGNKNGKANAISYASTRSTPAGRQTLVLPASPKKVIAFHETITARAQTATKQTSDSTRRTHIVPIYTGSETTAKVDSSSTLLNATEVSDVINNDVQQLNIDGRQVTKKRGPPPKIPPPPELSFEQVRALSNKTNLLPQRDPLQKYIKIGHSKIVASVDFSASDSVSFTTLPSLSKPGHNNNNLFATSFANTGLTVKSGGSDTSQYVGSRNQYESQADLQHEFASEVSMVDSFAKDSHSDRNVNVHGKPKETAKLKHVQTQASDSTSFAEPSLYDPDSTIAISRDTPLRQHVALHVPEQRYQTNEGQFIQNVDSNHDTRYKKHNSFNQDKLYGIRYRNHLINDNRYSDKTQMANKAPISKTKPQPPKQIETTKLPVQDTYTHSKHIGIKQNESQKISSNMEQNRDNEKFHATHVNPYKHSKTQPFNDAKVERFTNYQIGGKRESTGNLNRRVYEKENLNKIVAETVPSSDYDISLNIIKHSPNNTEQPHLNWNEHTIDNSAYHDAEANSIKTSDSQNTYESLVSSRSSTTILPLQTTNKVFQEPSNAIKDQLRQLNNRLDELQKMLRLPNYVSAPPETLTDGNIFSTVAYNRVFDSANRDASDIARAGVHTNSENSIHLAVTNLSEHDFTTIPPDMAPESSNVIQEIKRKIIESIKRANQRKLASSKQKQSSVNRKINDEEQVHLGLSQVPLVQQTNEPSTSVSLLNNPNVQPNEQFIQRVQPDQSQNFNRDEHKTNDNIHPNPVNHHESNANISPHVLSNYLKLLEKIRQKHDMKDQIYKHKQDKQLEQLPSNQQTFDQSPQDAPRKDLQQQPLMHDIRQEHNTEMSQQEIVNTHFLTQVNNEQNNVPTTHSVPKVSRNVVKSEDDLRNVDSPTALKTTIDKFAEEFAQRLSKSATNGNANGVHNIQVLPLSKEAVMSALRNIAISALKKKQNNTFAESPNDVTLIKASHWTYNEQGNNMSKSVTNVVHIPNDVRRPKITDSKSLDSARIGEDLKSNSTHNISAFDKKMELLRRIQLLRQNAIVQKDVKNSMANQRSADHNHEQYLHLASHRAAVTNVEQLPGTANNHVEHSPVNNGTSADNQLERLSAIASQHQTLHATPDFALSKTSEQTFTNKTEIGLINDKEILTSDLANDVLSRVRLALSTRIPNQHISKENSSQTINEGTQKGQVLVMPINRDILMRIFQTMASNKNSTVNS